MKFLKSRTGAVLVGATTLAALGGTGAAMADGQITGRDIKDGSIWSRDVGELFSRNVADGSLGYRDLNQYTHDLIESKASQSALDQETSERKAADEGLQKNKLGNALQADGPYPSATNLQEGDNSEQPWAPGPERQQAWVSCPDGQVAVGGGFGDNDGDDSKIRVVTSAPTQVFEGKIGYKPIEGDPDGSFTPNAWLVEGYNEGSSTVIVRPWVVCAPQQ